MPSKKAFLIAISLSGLLLSSCAPNMRKPETVQQSAAVQFDTAKLEQIIAQQKTELAKSDDSNDYKIWKDNPSFTGRWAENYSVVFGYSSYKRTPSSQELNNLRNDIKKQYAKNNLQLSDFQLVEFKNGISYGDAVLIQNTLIEASIQHIIPNINGVGYTPQTSKLRIMINSRADIPDIQRALNYMKAPPESVGFEVNKFILL